MASLKHLWWAKVVAAAVLLLLTYWVIAVALGSMGIDIHFRR